MLAPLKELRRLLTHTCGSVAMEFGLIAVMISMVVVAACQNYAKDLNGVFTSVAAALPGAVHSGEENGDGEPS